MKPDHSLSYMAACLVILSLSALLAAPAAHGEQMMQGRVVTDNTALNIRSGPGTAYDVIATAARGELLTLLTLNGDWYQVRLPDGRTGYAFRQYIQMTQSNLSATQAGAVTIGMPVDELYAEYSREQTQLIDLMLEGMFTPAINIYTSLATGQRPALTAEIGWNATWVISRVTVYDPQFRTECGIGVGSTLGALKRCYTLDWGGFGEGPLYVGVQETALSFAFDPADLPRNFGRTTDPFMLPDYLEITAIVCPGTQ